MDGVSRWGIKASEFFETFSIRMLLATRVWNGALRDVPRVRLEESAAYPILDTFYDRGSTFPLKWFLHEGVLQPKKSSECLSCFEQLPFRILGPLEYSSGLNLIFAQDGFRASKLTTLFSFPAGEYNLNSQTSTDHLCCCWESPL